MMEKSSRAVESQRAADGGNAVRAPCEGHSRAV